MGISLCSGPSRLRGVAGYNVGWEVGGGMLMGSQKTPVPFADDVDLVFPDGTCSL